MNTSDPFIVHYINFDTIRLLDQNGQFQNQVKTIDAQKIAKDAGLDLVCFNRPEGDQLAFCKIIDFNKWKYQQERARKKEQKNSRKENKEMRFSPVIEDHDIEHKMRQVNGFLDEGDDVTLTMRLYGRERLHFSDAEEKMNLIVSHCNGHGKEVSRKKTEDLIIVRMVKISKANGMNEEKREII